MDAATEELMRIKEEQKKAEEEAYDEIWQESEAARQEKEQFIQDSNNGPY